MATTKIIALIILLFLVVGFTGCTQENTIVEKDLYSNSTITLERSNMYTMEQFALQKITINQEGLLYETFYPNETLSNSTYTKFEMGEYESLIQVLKENDFEHFEDKYVSDVQVTDIGRGVITLSNVNREKIVDIDPYFMEGNPKEVANVIDKIQELINNANSPFKFISKLEYVGKQCEDDLWDIWYKEGNINYVMEPTEKQLINDYYASKGVDIISIDEVSNGIVCEACSVCPSANKYIIEINNYDREFITDDNWTEFKE